MPNRFKRILPTALLVSSVLALSACSENKPANDNNAVSDARAGNGRHFNYQWQCLHRY